MKGMFPQYEERTAMEFDNAWKNGLFVFDTNVLLNLYQYQAVTRDELINILNQLSSRIWIPHHVALEFQRNRLRVIAKQNRRFADVRRTVDSARSNLISELGKLQLTKRHSLIDPQPLTEGFSKLTDEKLTDEFLSTLDNLRQNQQGLTGPDPIKEKIEELLDGHVGAAPENQAAIDDIYKEADRRFKSRIPPGYEDLDKDKDEPDEYLHNGLIYKRKFGDYLIWRQVLKHTKENGIKQLILVTDDGKEDWWRKIDLEGPKTIGPRPELIEEACIDGRVITFLMHNTEEFLKYAKKFLKAKVSKNTLEEVRDVSIEATNKTKFRDSRKFAEQAEWSVFEWLLENFDRAEQNKFGFPDFIAYRNENRFGFEVKTIQNLKILSHMIKDILYRAYYEIQKNNFFEMTIVLVFSAPEDIEGAMHFYMKAVIEKLPNNIRLIIGTLDEDVRTNGRKFVPYANFYRGENNSLL